MQYKIDNMRIYSYYKLKVALGKNTRQGEKYMGESKVITLYHGEKGNLIKITSLSLEGVMRRRLLDLGFVPGAIVEVVKKSPLGDPIAYRVSQTTIALRKEESIRIEGELMNNG